MRERERERDPNTILLSHERERERERDSDLLHHSPGAGFSVLTAADADGDHMSLSDMEGCVREAVTDVPPTDRGTDDTGN